MTNNATLCRSDPLRHLHDFESGVLSTRLQDTPKTDASGTCLATLVIGLVNLSPPLFPNSDTSSYYQQDHTSEAIVWIKRSFHIDASHARASLSNHMLHPAPRTLQWNKRVPIHLGCDLSTTFCSSELANFCTEPLFHSCFLGITGGDG